MEQIRIQRPKAVEIAVNLIYLSIGIWILRFIITSTPQTLKQLSSLFTVFSMLFGLGFNLFLAFMISKGINWARVTFLLMCIIGLVISTLLPLFLKVNLISIISGIPGIGLQIFALFLLFQKKSSDWFKDMKIKKQFKA